PPRMSWQRSRGHNEKLRAKAQRCKLSCESSCQFLVHKNGRRLAVLQHRYRPADGTKRIARNVGSATTQRRLKGNHGIDGFLHQDANAMTSTNALPDKARLHGA